MYIHWALNDNSCILTMMEIHARGLKTKKESFIHNIIEPWFTPPSSDVLHAVEVFILAILTLVAANKWVYAVCSSSTQ